MSFPLNPNYGDQYTTLNVSYTFDGSAWLPKSTESMLLSNDPQSYPAGTSGVVEFNTDSNVFVPVNLPVVAGTGTTYTRTAITDGSLLKWDQTNNQFITAVEGMDYVGFTTFKALLDDFNAYKATHP